MKWLYGALLALCCAYLSACSPAAQPDIIDFEATNAPAATPTIQLNMIMGSERPAALPSAKPTPTPVQVQQTEPAAQEPELPASTLQQKESAAAASESPAPQAQQECNDSAVSAQSEDAGETENALLQSMQSLQISGMEYIPLALARNGVSLDSSEYRVNVTFSSKELLSCLVVVTKSKRAQQLVPITIEAQTGADCMLSDFFTREDTGWKSLLPDLVTAAALEQGMTLLCEVPPVSDDQPFYIDGGNIVLVYRPYEITTYEAGTPCFVLPMKKIAAYTTGAYGIGG